MEAKRIAVHPVHRGRGATAEIEPAFTESWGMWEMHPQGSELVLCTAGSMALHQKTPDWRLWTGPDRRSA